jgi:hypothetical protein
MGNNDNPVALWHVARTEMGEVAKVLANTRCRPTFLVNASVKKAPPTFAPRVATKGNLGRHGLRGAHEAKA